ncbi:MAG: class I SAM-dependent methyltransferase [Bdellovibrionota bacterium]
MQNDNEKRPYLDFYTTHKISPVGQDISALRKHFERRESLYRHLGIPSRLLRGCEVIEFGPGSGYNALFTASLNLARYVLVDGNPTAIQTLTKNFHEYNVPFESIEIVSSLIERFDTADRFDLVLCEGVVPFQLDSKAFFRHVAQFTKPGGIVVGTSIDSASFLGESLRRLIAMKLSPFSDPMEDRVKVLEPFFASHLKTLKGMNRPARDWVQDNIIIKYFAGFFSITDAIDSVCDGWTFYGSSPRFMQDWRWYKDLHGDERTSNASLKVQYLSNIANLTDYRFELPAHSPETGTRILRLAQDCFELMQQIEDSSEPSQLNCEAAAKIRELSHINEFMPQTKLAFTEAADFLEERIGADDFDNFKTFFGRGQQYVSFIRND